MSESDIAGIKKERQNDNELYRQILLKMEGIVKHNATELKNQKGINASLLETVKQFTKMFKKMETVIRQQDKQIRSLKAEVFSQKTDIISLKASAKH